MSRAKDVIARAKALLGQTAEDAPEPTPAEALAKLSADAAAYLAANQVADDVYIEITISKGDFKVSFERD